MYELWFARDTAGHLWRAVIHKETGKPRFPAAMSKGVGETMAMIRKSGYDISMVGICPMFVMEGMYEV